VIKVTSEVSVHKHDISDFNTEFPWIDIYRQY
jgi:hypothetical protein